MDAKTLGIVLVIVALLGSVAGRLVRGRAVSKAQDQFLAGDFEGMIKTLDGVAAKTGLPPFNLHYMRLNGFEAMQDIEGEKTELDVLLRMHCTDAQRRLVLARAMNFYEMQKDREGAEHVLELMESFEDKDLLRDARQTFAIVFKNSFAYIAEMEHQLADAEPDEKARLNYFLSLQYENKGDEARAKEHLDRVMSVFGAVPENPADSSDEADEPEDSGDSESSSDAEPEETEVLSAVELVDEAQATSEEKAESVSDED